jgi:aspartyl protease/PDZ domain-containing protein
MRRLLVFLLIVSSLALAQTQPTPTPAPTPAPAPNLPAAKDLVAKWAAAIHLPPTQPAAVMLTSMSNEDGIPGKVVETLTPDNHYQAMVTRKYDEAEYVLTTDFAQRRDWNGFVRTLKGRELARFRTAVFETAALIFGPPDDLNDATVGLDTDNKSYTLTSGPMLGAQITWTLDPQTGLPVKSTRPGDDTVITTIYEDWRQIGGILTPHRLVISETDKPAYTVTRNALMPQPNAPDFAALTPGLSDVTLDPNAPPIPFDFASAHILFKASLNGRLPIWWILDTGADQEVVNSTRLKDFGMKTYAKSATTGGGNSAEYDYATGATFTLPGVTLKNQHVAVLDQTGLERALGVPIGGIFGYDFISRFVVELDYEKQLMTLHDPAKWNFDGHGYVVPVTFDNGIPFADGTISVGGQQIPAYFVVDFGAQETMTLTAPFVQEHDLVKLAQTNASVNRPVGMEKEFFAQNNVRGHIDALDLGGLKVTNIPINMSVNTTGAYASKNFAGTVGESIYRRYHVFLDYPHERVILLPTNAVNDPFPERMTYGLSILASGADLHTYTIVSVRPGSQAEKDGFQKGDIVTALDGKPAAQFTLAELRAALAKDGALHSLQVVRQSKPVTVAAQIKLVSLDKQ